MNTTFNSTDVSSTIEVSDAVYIIGGILGVLIYVGGFTGNFFSFLLFIQKELRQISTGLLFLLLNIFSTLHLLSLIVEFLDSIFPIDIPSGVFRCQFILWLQNITRTMCSFLATTISIDRFLRSEYPVKSRIWCTPKNVVRLSIFYSLFSALLYAFYYYPLNLFDDQGNCSFTLDITFHLFQIYVLPPVRFLFICVLPTCIMVGCGGRMLFNIRQSRKRVTQQRALNIIPVMTIGTITSNTNSTGGNNQKSTVENMLFLMVLANVCTYIITQIPFNTYTVYYGYGTSRDYLTYSLIRAFLLMWSSIYFGVGFYLFSIASPQFRKQFLKKMKSICVCFRGLQQQGLAKRNNQH